MARQPRSTVPSRQPRVSEVQTDIDIKAALAEGLATMLFVLLGAGAVSVSGALSAGALDPARLVAIALAHGVAILVLVSTFGKISGGHINPAVTFAMVLTGKMGLRRGGTYVVAQVIGAVIGALLIKAMLPAAMEGNIGSHGLGNGVTVMQGLLVEIVLTATLVMVIFGTAVDPKGPGTIAPIAIGVTVLIIHLFAVPLTGAGVNPARSFGPALISGAWENHWIYWVGPLIGGGIGGLLYEYVFMKRGD